MNKAEQREVAKCRTLMAHFERTQDAATLGIVARTLGELVRSTRTLKASQELRAIAAELCVIGHTDFICAYWA